MTITVKGVAGTVGSAEWSQLFQDVGDAGSGMAVMSGLTATVSGSSLVVAAGRSLQAGTNLLSNASVTLSVTANATANPRVDRLVAQVDFAAASAAYTSAIGSGSSVATAAAAASAAAGSLQILVGTPNANPVEPGVNQTVGSLWQTPLYRFRVAAGSSVPTNLTSEMPKPRGGTSSRGDDTLTANSNGEVTISYSLSGLPSWFSVWSTNNNVECTPNWGSRTATSMTVQLRRRSDYTPITSGSYRFVWKAEA